MFVTCYKVIFEELLAEHVYFIQTSMTAIMSNFESLDCYEGRLLPVRARPFHWIFSNLCFGCLNIHFI